MFHTVLPTRVPTPTTGIPHCDGKIQKTFWKLRKQSQSIKMKSLLVFLSIFASRTTSKHLRTVPVQQNDVESVAPLPLREDVFHLLKSSESTAKQDLITLSSSRPDNEHNVDEWAKNGMNSIKITIEQQMQSHNNLFAHMSGWLNELLQESILLKQELDKKLKNVMKPSIELHHTNKGIEEVKDSRTPYEKVIDKANNELRKAVVRAQEISRSSSGGNDGANVVDGENKYIQTRREKYHKLGKLVYAVEKSMNDLKPSVDKSNDVLSMADGNDMPPGLKDTVTHIEHMLSKTKVTLDAVKGMKSDFNFL